MAHEVASMMYVGETPWHGLGVKMVTPPSSSREALHIAKADFEVEGQPVWRADGVKVASCQVIIRKDTKAELGYSGADWTPIQPVDACSIVDPLIQSGDVAIEACGVLRGGKRVWILAKLVKVDASVIVPGVGDVVEKYVLIALGNDGTMGLRAGLTGTRVVCMNTLQIALRAGERTDIRISHLSSAKGNIEALKHELQAWNARFESAAEVFRALAGVKVRGEAQLREYVDAVFHANKAKKEAEEQAKAQVASGSDLFGGLLTKPSKLEKATLADRGTGTKETKSRIFEEVRHLFTDGRGAHLKGVRGTAWGAYNAVTEYLTWEKGDDANIRMDNAWLSTGGANSRALPAAIDTFLKAA